MFKIKPVYEYLQLLYTQLIKIGNNPNILKPLIHKLLYIHVNKRKQTFDTCNSIDELKSICRRKKLDTEGYILYDLLNSGQN